MSRDTCKNDRRTVAIVCKYVPQYRERFFELLRSDLLGRGLSLRLIYGDPGREDASRADAVELPWGIKVPIWSLRVGNTRLYWQHCLSAVGDSDLVVVEQASKLLVNYVLLAQQRLGRQRLALWGHGLNLRRHDASRIGEAVKIWLSRRVWWWFAYTDATAAIVRDLGFPEERITIVQNAIDTRDLAREYARLSCSADGARKVRLLREQWGITGHHVGLFVGALYKEKRLRFLIQACRRIRELVDDFELIVIGAGPESEVVVSAAAALPWVHAVGPVYGFEKVAYFALANVMLAPGLVGLNVLDSFACETPMVTTRVPYHSPEFAYLRHDENGLALAEHVTAEEYGEAVAALLLDQESLQRLRRGCKAAQAKYTIEEMVQRFAGGVVEALDVQGVA